MTSERDVHPDDGTIHAWLDRQLDDTSAATLEAHLQRCDECAERVAEARGLIAGASRILSSLDVDAAPTAKLSALDAVKPPVEPRRTLVLTGTASAPRWFRLTPARSAIAAVLVVAVATAIVREHQQPNLRRVSTSAAVPAAMAPAAQAPSTAAPIAVAPTALPPVAAPMVAEYDSTAGARVAAARTFAKAQRETTVNADLARVAPAPASAPTSSMPTGQTVAAAKVAAGVTGAANREELRNTVPEVGVASGSAVAAGGAKPAPRAATTAGVEVPQCYRVESATGAAANWGPVPLPFVLALDAPATSAGARILTATGQDSEAHAVFEHRGGDSLLFSLRRLGYTGTLAVGVPGEVRAGVMRSAPTSLQLESVVATAAPRASEPKRALRAQSAGARSDSASVAADREAAPAVPVVVRKVECAKGGK